MKHIILSILTIFGFFYSFCQKIPSNEIILSKIYGSTDIGRDTYTCKYLGDEVNYSNQDSITYSIVYKNYINLKSQKLILAIIKAPYGYQHGHQLGYQNIYFLKFSKGKITLIDSIISDGIEPIGESSEIDIIDIGKNKKALITTFQSSGNLHLEVTKSINFLESNKLTYLLSINTLYDNSAWTSPETEESDCEAERYEENFEIIKTNSEWHTIKVNHTEYRFTKGCIEDFVTSKNDIEYTFQDGTYKVKQK
jgi:hypothetical protein